MSGVIAGVSFGIALGLLLTFFVTGSKTADRWSNVAFLAFYVSGALVVHDIHQRYVERTAVVWAATAVTAVALGVLFVSQALVLAGRIDFRRVAIVQTVGFAVYILWILAASVLVLAFGGPPSAVGWLGAAAVIASLAVLGWFARDPALIRGDREPDRFESALGILPFLGITAWLILLGLN